MSCIECKETNCGENRREIATIPVTVYEADAARAERTNRRLWILCIILVVLLVASNIAWVVYENQFVDMTYEIEQDAKNGTNNYIGNDGDIYNGETDHKNTDKNP